MYFTVSSFDSFIGMITDCTFFYCVFLWCFVTFHVLQCFVFCLHMLIVIFLTRFAMLLDDVIYKLFSYCFWYLFYCVTYSFLVLVRYIDFDCFIEWLKDVCCFLVQLTDVSCLMSDLLCDLWILIVLLNDCWC